MKEKNKNTLKKTLDQLPGYSPSPKLWEGIENQLFAGHQQQKWKEAVQRLPSYSPPHFLWKQIEKKLNRTKKITGLRPWLWRAAAVIIPLFFAMWAYFFLPSGKEKVSIAYTQEAYVEPPSWMDWNEDEDAFQTVRTSILENEALSQNPETRQLLAELDELDEAKKELENMLESYGPDVYIVLKISEIERERSELLKKMALLFI